MIIFHAIRWRNFLSTGNIWIEIPLDAHSNTLIVGENGAGKSTIVDALTFALFGKPFRNINKPQLVNTINSKDCLVELGFSIGSKKYLIRRGIKPNIFEIHVNGKLLDQDARVKDYQETLERTILKMNYKSFTQIVVLGSGSFTPFMQLPAADRRAVIEDLLDIQIFSHMNLIVKDRLIGSKIELGEVKIRLDAVKEKIELQKRHIEELKKNNQEMVASKRKVIDDNYHNMVALDGECVFLNNKVMELAKLIKDESTYFKTHRKLVTYEAKIDNNKRKIEKEVEFYQDNDTCPTCKQDIQSDHKAARIHECVAKVSEMNIGLEKLRKEQNVVVEKLAKISKINEEIQSLGRDIANTHSAIIHTRRYIDILEQEVNTLGTQNTISGDTEEQSRQLFKEFTGYIERHREIIDIKSYLDIAATLLKDGGIKTRIIRQYLPIINKLVNKYLAAMDFFVNFTMDEEFKEIIKSRHRDDFSYENFSQGEKQRIDLALLMTWRAVARLKNSVNTNLLILDETFDSSLDPKGTDALMQILSTMPDNTFVISHKDQMHDKFANSIRFEKKQNFTRIAA